MTTPQEVAVTYKGTDNPFKDRIYRSGLTFTPGQTRVLPEQLAARFLRHDDVFERAADKMAVVVQKVPEQGTTEGQQTTPATTSVEHQSAQQGDQTQQLDDTQTQLAAAKKAEDDQRLQDDARFSLLQSIDAMDRKALIGWAEVNYKQKIPGNSSLDKARDMARGFIDQFGMPA